MRELGADGIIRRIAGSGRSGSPRDGEAALDAPLDGQQMRVAAMAGGEAVIVEGSASSPRVWLVDSAGRLRRIRGLPRATDIAVLGLPDDSLLLAPDSSGRLLRRWPDGRMEQLLAGRFNSRMGHAHDGDAGPLSMAPLGPLDMAVAGDGGLLLLEYGNDVPYVAPAQPRRLAVGIARETLSSRLPVEVTVEATLAAHATVELRVGGVVRETQTVELPAGRSTTVLHNARPGALNVISVHATSPANGGTPSQVASDRPGLLPGATLPMSVVKREEGDEADFVASIGGGRNGIRCQRFAAGRIDCAEHDFGVCQGVTAYFLRRDGVLVIRGYAHRADCRLRRRPRWGSRPYAVALPT